LNKLEKYIKFILLKAVRLSSDYNLVVWCSEKQNDFATAVCEYAHKIGVENTEIYFADNLSDFEVPQDKVMHWKMNRYKLLWVYSDSCTALPPLTWTTVNVATENWAKQIFPEICDLDLAVRKLWEAIFTACRIDDNDPVENWNRHIANLDDKANKLNSFNFEKLVFKSNLGTGFSVSLIKNHKWINCTTKNYSGETVITNIPTEEVFTAPDAATANGIVYASKPLFYNNEKIDNFYLKFENGRVTDLGAQQNGHLLKQLIASCKNADRIGEIAIVPHSSPISQLDIFWYDTSFDENAGCHMALGYSYPQTLRGYTQKEDDELEQLGFNHCDIHEDFVIGTDDMEIAGITADGNAVIIMKNGEWNI